MIKADYTGFSAIFFNICRLLPVFLPLGRQIYTIIWRGPILKLIVSGVKTRQLAGGAGFQELGESLEAGPKAGLGRCGQVA